ncbi:DMT family transporter [Novosphingobium sp. 1748]|nr:DMT family transporter [Novosphingobium sp. 1748]
MVLIGITMLWGTTFLIVHTAMQYSGALFFVGLRFMVAGAGGWLLFRRTMRDLNRRELGAGALIGFAIFLGYGLQTYGLRTITSSQSAFITALYVPMVPLLQLVVLRRMPHIMSWIGIALAFAGLILLAGPKAGHIGLSPGEMATLLSAVAIAAEIILISRFAHGVDSRRVTVVQLLAAGLFSLAAMPLAGETLPAFSPVWLVAGVGLGLASTLIQLAMNWAQKTVSPTRATVIYAGEPVWGGIVGRIAGDRLPALAMLGGVLILVGVLVSELRGSAQDAP